MPYPIEFQEKLRILFSEYFPDKPEAVIAMEQISSSKELADVLRMATSGPSPARIIQLLDEGKLQDLRVDAQLGIRAEALLKELKENWREWCPDDPPGHFRASVFCPEGELVEF
jgi:hypothetical protein